MTTPERIVAWAWGGRPNSGQWTDTDGICPGGIEYIRSDLHEAEIASLTAERDAALAGRVKVKPLVWVKHPTKDIWRCESLIGTYKVFGIGATPSWDFDDYYGSVRISNIASTIESAKAAAYAHLNATVRAVLEPQHITVQDAERVPEIKALIDAVYGYRRAIESFDGSGSMTNKIASMDGWRDALDSALRAIAEQETK